MLSNQKEIVMRKSLILGVFGLVAAATSSFGAPGYILMDNYNTSGPNVTYGPGGGGVVGTGLLAGWTAGIYYAAGNVLSQVANDPTGFGIPAASEEDWLWQRGLAARRHLTAIQLIPPANSWH